jgi:hypothetical protein
MEIETLKCYQRKMNNLLPKRFCEIERSIEMVRCSLKTTTKKRWSNWFVICDFISNLIITVRTNLKFEANNNSLSTTIEVKNALIFPMFRRENKLFFKDKSTTIIGTWLRCFILFYTLSLDITAYFLFEIGSTLHIVLMYWILILYPLY